MNQDAQMLIKEHKTHFCMLLSSSQKAAGFDIAILLQSFKVKRVFALFPIFYATFIDKDIVKSSFI